MTKTFHCFTGYFCQQWAIIQIIIKYHLSITHHNGNFYNLSADIRAKCPFFNTKPSARTLELKPCFYSGFYDELFVIPEVNSYLQMGAQITHLEKHWSRSWLRS